MRIQSWNYLDTVEVIGSIPVAPIELFLPIQYFTLIHYPRMLGFSSEQNWTDLRNREFSIH